MRDWTAKNPGPAVYSACRRYRYRLERPLSECGRTVAFVMVNPSTATEHTDDQTILMVQRVCRTFGFGRAIIGNLFGYRTPNVADLAAVDDSIGDGNDLEIRKMASEADLIIAAWGAPSKLPVGLRDRWRAVTEILVNSGKTIHCLKHLKGDHPRHPQILVHEDPLPIWRRPV